MGQRNCKRFLLSITLSYVLDTQSAEHHPKINLYSILKEGKRATKLIKKTLKIYIFLEFLTLVNASCQWVIICYNHYGQ